jgi:phosphoenolpyruvate---glycerone phosphotransferase subunit DhaL
MSKAQLPVAELAEMFCHVADHIEANVDCLTEADQAIGDGDHGVGMVRGFTAARQKLASQPPDTVAGVLRAVGMALLTATGGAAGAIFGTLFRGGAKRLDGAVAFDAAALALFLEDGLQAVQERGHAAVGDKTMVDALAPAAARAHELTGETLDVALAGAAEAAREGMEATAPMLAALGKARALGERACGHVDPGALSVVLILEAMAEYAR